MDCDLEITLPFADFEEALASMVARPQLVARMDLLETSIATTLLFVDPAVVPLAMVLYSTWCATYIRARFSSLVSSTTP